VNLEEEASLLTECCLTDDSIRTVPYRARTQNNMLCSVRNSASAPTGLGAVAVEGWAKGGLMGVAREQSQDPLVDYTGL